MLPALSFLIQFRTPILLAALIACAGLAFLRYDYVVKENKRLTEELRASNEAVGLLGEKLDREAGITVQADKLKKEVQKIESAPVPPDIDSAIDGIEQLREDRRK